MEQTWSGREAANVKPDEDNRDHVADDVDAEVADNHVNVDARNVLWDMIGYQAKSAENHKEHKMPLESPANKKSSKLNHNHHQEGRPTTIESTTERMNSSAAAEQVSDLEHAHARLQGENHELIQQNAALKRKRNHLEEEIESQTQRSKFLKAQIHTELANLSDQQSTLNAVKQAKQASQQSQAETEALHQQLLQAQQKIGSLEELIRHLKDQLKASQEEVSNSNKADSNTSELTHTINLLNRRLHDSEAWTQQIKDEYDKKLSQAQTQMLQWQTQAKQVDMLVKMMYDQNNHSQKAALKDVPCEAEVEAAEAKASLLETVDKHWLTMEKELSMLLKGVREALTRFSAGFDKRLGTAQGDIVNMVLDVKDELRTGLNAISQEHNRQVRVRDADNVHHEDMLKLQSMICQVVQAQRDEAQALAEAQALTHAQTQEFARSQAEAQAQAQALIDAKNESNEHIEKLFSRIARLESYLQKLQKASSEAAEQSTADGHFPLLRSGLESLHEKLDLLNNSLEEQISSSASVSQDAVGLCFRELHSDVRSFHERSESLLEQVLSSSVSLSDAIGNDLVSLVGDTLSCVDSHGESLDRLHELSERQFEQIEHVDRSVHSAISGLEDIHSLQQTTASVVSNIGGQEQGFSEAISSNSAVCTSLQSTIEKQNHRSLALWVCGGLIVLLHIALARSYSPLGGGSDSFGSFLT